MGELTTGMERCPCFCDCHDYYTDLYDGGVRGAIPWDEIQEFFEKYLG